MPTQLELNFFDFSEPEPQPMPQSQSMPPIDVPASQPEPASQLEPASQPEPVPQPAIRPKVTKKLPSTVGLPKSKTRYRLLAAMLANPHITVQLLQEQLGLSRRGLEDCISRLKKEGLLQRKGSDTKGTWHVVGKNLRSQLRSYE